MERLVDRRKKIPEVGKSYLSGGGLDETRRDEANNGKGTGREFKRKRQA